MRVLLFIVAVLSLLSCDKSFKAKKPNKLIEKQIMIDIMYDIKLINAAKSQSYKRLQDSNVVIDKFVYHKYKIDSLTLRQNLDYYATKSFKTFKEMESRVRERLVEEKERVAAERKVEDSLAKLEINKQNVKKTEKVLKPIGDKKLRAKLPRKKLK